LSEKNVFYINTSIRKILRKLSKKEIKSRISFLINTKKNNDIEKRLIYIESLRYFIDKKVIVKEYKLALTYLYLLNKKVDRLIDDISREKIIY
jgi:hypothetical protein